MSKKDKQPEQRLTECVINWVEKLAVHFNASLDDEHYTIFTNALRNNTIYQVDKAFERCMNECEFMPRLRDVHLRMPEEKYPPENPGKFMIYAPPVVDEVRKIVEEICPDYESLSDKESHDVFFRAARLRYQRMGIDFSKWKQEEDARESAREKIEKQKETLRQKGLL